MRVLLKKNNNDTNKKYYSFNYVSIDVLVITLFINYNIIMILLSVLSYGVFFSTNKI